MEIEKFEGDIFWNADDPETAVYDAFDELANVGEYVIVEFQQAKMLSNIFGVLIGGEERYFTTKAEAEQAAKEI
jgi:hypothetical protein